MPNLRSKTWTTTTPANVEDAQFWEDHLISNEDAAKAASSVQSVNNTTPDASGNVDVVALPSGGTTGQVLTKQSSADGDADWDDPASSGHTIQDEDGTVMTQQPTMQFTNAEVTNDSLNARTIVDCRGSKGDPGDAATVTVGTVSTLPAGSSATVVNSGTSSAAVFDFGIPKGADGSGAGDMLKGDYDPDSDVELAGGIVAYVESKEYTLPTASAVTLGGVKVGTNLSIDANGVLSATDTTYSDATASVSGLMSATDKAKLNGIASGAEANVQSDWNEADTTSDAYILNKPSIPTVSTSHTGTASLSGVRKQQITINGSSYDIDGSLYMEADASSTPSATFLFQNAAILTTSAIDVYTDTWGDNPDDVQVAAGSCTVTFGQSDTRKVRIYIK